MTTREFGPDFALIGLLEHGVGVHHSGLSDELRVLVEHLLENGDLTHLVATTTVAQGVNFPVANVVLAAHQFPFGEAMPAADFWNLAGRAGRIDQGQVGIIALASPDEEHSAKLTAFVGRQVETLNSTLIDMVTLALQQTTQLDLSALAWLPEWSAFVQYLAHTYRQIGNHDVFASEVEQVLRGTFGFQALRAGNLAYSLELVRSVRAYANRLAGQPLALVDSTGLSWESVVATLARLSDASITPDIWEASLFADDPAQLARLIGIMMQVPELRENLVDPEETSRGGGVFVAHVVSDWVNGRSLADLASHYFKRPSDGSLEALTRCCSRLFGKIAPTVAWGLSAMQALTLGSRFDDLDKDQQRQLRNLPSYAFYGVNSEASMAMRLLGVPRSGAHELAEGRLPSSGAVGTTLHVLRERIASMDVKDWESAMGASGAAYQRVWKVMSGVA